MILQVDARALIALSRGFIVNDTLSYLNLSANTFAGLDGNTNSRFGSEAASPHRASGRRQEPRPGDRQSAVDSMTGQERAGRDARRQLDASEGGGRVRWQDQAGRNACASVNEVVQAEAETHAEAVSDHHMIALLSEKQAKLDQEEEEKRISKRKLPAAAMRVQDACVPAQGCPRRHGPGPRRGQPRCVGVGASDSDKGGTGSVRGAACAGGGAINDWKGGAWREGQSPAESLDKNDMAPCLPRSRSPSRGAWWNRDRGAQEDIGEDTVEDDKEGEEEVEWGHGAGPGAIEYLGRYLSVTRSLTYLGICCDRSKKPALLPFGWLIISIFPPSFSPPARSGETDLAANHMGQELFCLLCDGLMQNATLLYLGAICVDAV